VARLFPALLVLALLLAGCLGGSCDAPKAQSVTTAPTALPGENATLPPGAADASEANRTLGAMPHVHDYWQGRERVTVLDQDVTVDPQTAAFWTGFSLFLEHNPSVGGAFVQLPAGNLIYEGTGRLDLTVTYTDPTITGLHVQYRHAGTDEFSKYLDTPSGKTVPIPITSEMTDMPHSKTSRWLFLFETSSPAAVAVGKFHVKMDIVKMRDVALFPPHPDFWKGKTTLELLRASGAAKSSMTPDRLVERTLNPLEDPPGLIGDGKPVPMETRTLVVNVTVKGTSPSTLAIDHLDLQYHGADGFHSFVRPAGKANATSSDKKQWEWDLPVAMNQTDNPYADKSAWDFRVVASYANPVPGGPPCSDGCYNAETDFDIVVTAIKDPAMSEGM
jgi:hypothetical protein